MRLWRVSIVNRYGYEAPNKYVEGRTRKEASLAAKKSSTLVQNFEKQWSFRLTPMYVLTSEGVKAKNDVPYIE